jgi:glutaconate CoA-transferase, subunit A
VRPSVRPSSLRALDDAVSVVEDGMTVGIGGAVTAGHPMALVRGLVRRGVRGLTVLAPLGGIEVDLLVAAGCVDRVVGCYAGVEVVAAVAPVFRSAVEAGRVEVIDLDEAQCVMGLRAAGHQIPFFPWRGGVGTSLPELNPWLVEFEDPVRGEPLLAVPALELDVALIFADVADRYGNAQAIGSNNMDPNMASAAEHVVIQVDRVVSTDTIREHAELTMYWPGATVVHAPFGTHPYSSGRLIADEQHLRDYVTAARAGDPALSEYLRVHVTAPVDHEDYLEAIGVRRLVSLML